MELVADESKGLNSCWTASSTDLQGFDALNFHLVIPIQNPEHVGDLTLNPFYGSTSLLSGAWFTLDSI